MSGLYLVVWDDNAETLGPVLQPTTGGWPHATIFYSGELIPRHDLVRLASIAMVGYTLEKVTLTRAYVNSFQLGGDGDWRHDCLLELDPTTTAAIEDMRKTVVKTLVSTEVYDQLAMRTPHVTVGCHASKEACEAHVQHVNTLLPRTVDVNGWTF